jgi:transposase
MATRKSFTMSTKERRRRNFSESFKKEKVRQLERGELKPSEIVKLYEVSYTSINRWMRKYGSEPKFERLVVETESDSKMLLLQREKIAELEQLVGQKQIEIEFYKKMIDIAEEQYSIGIKKNCSTRSSGSSGSSAKKTPSV